MGFFSNIGKAIGLGGSSNVGRRAAEQQRIFNREAIERGDIDFGITEGKIGEQQTQLREDFTRQRDLTEEGFAPVAGSLEQGLGFLRETGTAEGFNQALSDIIGGDLFQSLRNEQERGARSQLAASGLTGAGGALEQLSQISPQLALQLFGNLQGTNLNLANIGLQGVTSEAQLGNQLTLGQGGLSTGLTDLESQLRNQVSGRAQGLISGIGRAESSGINTDEEIESQRFNNLINLIGTGGSLATGGGGGGGGGRNLFSRTTQTGPRSRSTVNFF